MKYAITILSLSMFILGCNSVKRNQKFLAQGDYDRGIELAVKKLQKDKNSEKNDSHIILLETGFKKAVEDDFRRLNYLKKDTDPATTREIYSIYSNLSRRQELIRPLLPLYSRSLDRNAFFKFKEYSSDIFNAKANFVSYLYNEAQSYMNRQQINDYRTAYDIYCEIDEIQSNFKDVKNLKEDAHFYGTDFVFVSLENRSGQLIPYQLERSLLDFNTYGMDDFWTEYHAQHERGINYSFGITFSFMDIRISPERIFEHEIYREVEISDGWVYKRDRNGTIINDADGKPIKIEKRITVQAKLFVTEQSKSVLVGGEVRYQDLISNRTINRHPLSTEFIFENVFASFQGDKRALNGDDWNLVSNRFVYFPSNEQMVLDAGESIKERLKEILKNNPIR